MKKLLIGLLTLISVFTTTVVAEVVCTTDKDGVKTCVDTSAPKDKSYGSLRG